MCIHTGIDNNGKFFCMYVSQGSLKENHLNIESGKNEINANFYIETHGIITFSSCEDIFIIYFNIKYFY